MAILKLQRTSEYANRIRDYQIFMDGEKIGVIANGETKEFDIAPGPHVLLAKIDWASSPELPFEAADNRNNTFIVGGFKNANWLMPVSLVIVVVLLVLNYTKRIGHTSWIILFPTVLILFYYVTFGRKKYLTLSALD